MLKEVLAPTRQATLTLLLREGESSASSLANSLGISVQAMRRHLRSLEEDGLVKANQVSIGPGRPFNLWELTQEGENRFPNSSENFAIELLNSLETSFSKESITTLFSMQAQKKAANYHKKIGPGSVKDRLKKLVELRRLEGYMAELKPLEEKVGWYLSEFHCSIRRIAEEHPAICDQELKLIRHMFPECHVERVKWRIDGGHSCGFQVTPKEGYE